MANVRKPGRPKGSVNHKPCGVSVRDRTPFSRKNAREHKPGLKRMLIETDDPDLAIGLEKLAEVLEADPLEILNKLN